MRRDGRRHIAGKIFVDDSGRTNGQKRDAFFEGAPRRNGCGAQHDGGRDRVFNEDFAPGAHMSQQAGEVADGVRFGDANCGHLGR